MDKEFLFPKAIICTSDHDNWTLSWFDWTLNWLKPNEEERKVKNRQTNEWGARWQIKSTFWLMTTRESERQRKREWEKFLHYIQLPAYSFGSGSGRIIRLFLTKNDIWQLAIEKPSHEKAMTYSNCTLLHDGVTDHQTVGLLALWQVVSQDSDVTKKHCQTCEYLYWWYISCGNLHLLASLSCIK